MMTVNVDTSNGLVNGATGVLREIGFSTSNTPNILWIQFLDESIEVQLPSRAFMDPSYLNYQELSDLF